jgi:dipeptidyl aminopeptidase/acylaminoacyl peptidase
MITVRLLAAAAALALASPLAAQSAPSLTARDLFDLEWISDIDVAAGGGRILYLRNGFDLRQDQRTNRLWIIDRRGDAPRPIATGFERLSSPRFSPDGTRIAFVATAADGRGAQLFVHWLASGHTVRITQLLDPPQALAWAPDGRRIAFLMRLPEKPTSLATLPEKPEGATWAPAPRVMERLIWRRDGSGLVEPGFVQLFVVPAEGGTPLQLTDGPFAHAGTPAWLPDSRSVVISGNRRDDWEYEAANSELYRVDVDSRAITRLTDRFGPDHSPAVSPDGRYVAYLGFDDARRSHADTAVYLFDLRSNATRRLSPVLPGAVGALAWADDSRSLVVQYDAEGDTHLARLGLDGRLRDLVTGGVGGLDLGRPYAAAQFALAGNTLAFTATTPHRPAELAVRGANGRIERLTDVNADLLGERALATVEARWIVSPVDGARIHAWVVKPPGFDPAQKYPLILEIHGGPHTNYGPRFAAEMQLFAAAGYVVLYTNPRGSTSYGEDFANLIDKDYPGRDYDDLMAAVDALAAEPWIDERNLFVTGGSGGGLLTAWIVGKTTRFRAAVAAKPVINWTSLMTTSDIGATVNDLWFPGFPWDHPEDYLRRSPLSLIASVETPTMLLTGEDDFRTPMSESEQFYQALRMRRVPAALVRFPDAAHALVTRPSQLAAKIAFILGWFDRYRLRA